MLLVTIRYLWLLNEEFCPAPSLGEGVFIIFPTILQSVVSERKMTGLNLNRIGKKRTLIFKLHIVR